MAFTVAERRDVDLIITRGASGAAVRAIQRRCLSGELVRLAPGIYLRERDPQAQALRVRQHWVRILGELVPGSVVSYRSAYAAVPSEELLVLSHPTRFNRTIRLPGLRISLVKGPGPLPHDTPLGDGALHLASMERMLLENLTRPRGAEGRSRGEAAVRERLSQILNGEGSEALDRLRQRARELAGPLDMVRELERLESIMDLLSPTLATDGLAHLVRGEPPRPPLERGDGNRLTMLRTLASRLQLQRWPRWAASAVREPDRSNQAFIEAWFDCFESGELRDIMQARAAILGAEIVAASTPPMRELLSVFKLAASSPLCDSVPPFGAWFAQGLKARHSLMMHLTDPDLAGEFRTDEPERIEGTLGPASTLALSVPEGLARAIFYLVLLWSVQPFQRGNERLGRLLMNAELSSVGDSRIVIPTRMRGHLQRAMDRLLRHGDERRIVRLLVELQRWTASLDFSDLDLLVARLTGMAAFEQRAPGFVS
ncbi:MAG TPA: Fic family protein [Burkholderiaceae bacterium]|nr:Fic family protein [Burkholderiaceae bacterium]